MPVSFSKINTVNDGVLVCVDEAKDLYKYIKLEDVKVGTMTLRDVLKNLEIKITNLEQRVKTLEDYRIQSATIIDAIASENGDGI